MPRPKLSEDLKRDVPVYCLLRKGEARRLDQTRGRKSRGGVLREVFLKSKYFERRKRKRGKSRQ